MMNLFVLFVGVLILVCLYVVPIAVLKGKARVWGISLLTGLIFGVSALGWVYATNHVFRMAFDTRFNQEKEFVSYANGHSIPLLPRTAYAYRMSEEEVTYFTTLSDEEIVNYFQGIADIDVKLEKKDANTFVLTRQHNKYTITLENSTEPAGTYVSIVAE
ncbi:MAG: hypothetical protein ACXVPC_06445 [Tumebacillaceae bacterium]